MFPRLQLQTVAILALCLLTFTFPAPSSAGDTLFTEPSDEDFLILSVQLDRITLSQDLIAYMHPEGVLLPLGELSKLLNLAITVKPEQGLAEGFFLSEDRHFFLDVPTETVTVEGKPDLYLSDLVEVHWDDIYVEKDLLSHWLPLDLEVSFFTLTLTVEPREPLPLQLLLERQRRIARMWWWLTPPDPGYPQIDAPYTLISEPTIDQNITISLGQVQDWQMRYSTLLTGDLAYMTTRLHLTGSESDPISDTRMTMGRKSPKAELLGPLRAREFSFGNIHYPGLSLISTGGQDLGLKISSYPLQRPLQFDYHTFQCDLQPGWDVELYRNNVLIDYQPPGNEGFYQFENVPLLYGMNHFRLIFHGPEGQRKEESYQFNIGTTLISEDDQYYLVVFCLDQNRILLDYVTGLSQNLTMHMGLANLAVDRYAQLGLSSFYHNSSFHGKIAASNAGDLAGQISSLTGLGWGSLALEHIYLKDFNSEVFKSEPDLESRTRFRLDSSVTLPERSSIPLTLTGTREQYQSGATYDRLHLTTSTSTYYNSMRLQNRLNFDWRENSLTSTGYLTLAQHLGSYNIRGQIDYDLVPQFQFSDLALRVDGDLFENYRLGLSLEHNISTSDPRISLRLSREFANFSARLNTNYTTSGNFNLGLSLSFNLSREPHEKKWYADARFSSGLVSARVFLTADDAEGQPLSNIGFLVNNKRHSVRTDEQGIAFIKDLPVNRPVDLSVDIRTLEDPSWILDKEGVRITPRPGQVITVDFPVLFTSEIDGTVRLQRDDQLQGISGIIIELLGMDGTIVNRTRSAFDGFYIITEVPPGQYRLRLNPEQIERFNLKPTPEQTITVTPDGEWISGMDFVVSKENRP